MAKSIILVNPWIHDFSAYDLWMKPLGLLYIASYLEKSGYKVSLVDCLDGHSKEKSFGCGELLSEVIPKPALFKDIPRKYKRYGITPEAFSKKLVELKKSNHPILIGITSMMTYWYPGVFETINHIKNIFPDTPIALGGIYATLCYEHAVKFSGADYVIKGPGEKALLQLADRLSGKNVKERLTIDPNKHPYPAYHLYPVRNNSEKNLTCCKEKQIPLSDISNGVYPSLSHIAMITSKGCPFRCTYCASSLLYDGFNQRDPKEIIAEIEYYINRFNIHDIAFYDDALLVNPEKHIEPLLDLIIEKKINKSVNFHTPNGLHVRYISANIARKLYISGFKTIRLGFEGAQSHIQEKSSRKVTNKEFIDATDNLKKAGYKAKDIGVYLLVGLPEQKIEEIKESIDFIKKLGCKAKIAQYTPVPGTKYFDKSMLKYGLASHEPLLQNKNIYPLKALGLSFDELESIKDAVKTED
jgi:radical SAM superfamily enzyme YgiQ (UPF0313 family)